MAEAPEAGAAEAVTVLVVNAGSSSLKYQLVDPRSGDTVAKGLVQRIGEDGSDVPDHAAAFASMHEDLQEQLERTPPLAVGHRVVHGGADFTAPTLVDDDVIDTVRRLVPLAPLHNPGNLEGIEVARRTFPELPQVAVFDTAFHATMPPAAYTYAVPRVWREQHRVRRYGFHGTSHAFVSRRTAELLGQPLDAVNTVVLHLGNGASACAVEGGRSVDTSMGLSPLDGLVMGTRPGDVDPGLPGHLARVAGLSLEDYERALSRESGLLALTGVSDVREVMARRAAGDADAAMAFDVVVHRLVRHLGALAAVLGRLDAVAFTGGVGENDVELREAVVRRVALLGLELDADANAEGPRERRITTAHSRVAAFVIPTNEEWEIARQTYELVSAAGAGAGAGG